MRQVGYLQRLFTKIHIQRSVLIADTKIIASEQEAQSVSIMLSDFNHS